MMSVDILNMPTIAEIYGKDELKILAPAVRGYIFRRFFSSRSL